MFIIWIVLFEFLLPENNFLPKPWIVLISIPDLFEDYNFLAHFLTTVSAIYLPGIISYLLAHLIREHILKESGILKSFIGFISKISIFIPAFLAAVLTIYWFPHSFSAEYIFSFLVSFLWWMIVIESAGKIRNENYLVAFKSLGADEAFLNKNLVWNEIKPEVFKKLFSFHNHFWALILVYEFMSEGYGLGTIIKRTLVYHDFSALILILAIIVIMIFAGYYFLKYLEDKFIFWEAE